MGVEDVISFKVHQITTRLSPQSVKHLFRILRRMFDHALDRGHIRGNPPHKVNNPGIPRVEMDFLTADEVGLFLDKESNRWYA